MNVILIGCLLVLADAEEPAHPEAASPEAASEVQRLTDLWKGWREESRSLRISGWRFMGVGAKDGETVMRDELLPVVFDQLIPLVQARKSDIDRVELEAITEPLFSGDPKAKEETKGRAFARWQKFEFMEGAAGRRLDYETKDQDKQNVVRKDGKEQRYRSRIKQASLHPSETSLYMESLDDFLYVPVITRLRQFDAAPGGRCYLKNPGQDGTFVVEYDRETGFIFRDSRQFATGAYLLERTQDVPMTVGEISIPRFIARIQYRTDGTVDSAVRLLFMYILDSAEINAPVADADFQISVPKSTTIVDFGKEVPSPSSSTGKTFLARRMPEPVDDVLAESQKAEFLQGPTPPHAELKDAGDRRINWLIAANAIVLLVMFGWWFRVRRKV